MSSVDKILNEQIGYIENQITSSERKYIGECAKNPIAISRGRKSGVSMFKRFRRLYSPLGDNPFINFRYTLRHFGLLRALHVFIALHINNVMCDRLYEWKNKKR